jgi:membrane protein required for colicin V production
MEAEVAAASFNWLDVTVITVVLISTVVALLRGFVRELLSLAGWVGSGILTLVLFDQASTIAKGFIENKMVAYGVAGLSLFIGSMILFAIISSIIVKYVKQSEFSAVDRSLGLIFGFARGAFLVSLCFLALTMVVEKGNYPDFVKEAKTRQLMEFGAVTLKGVAPEYTKDLGRVADKTKETVESKVSETVDTVKKVTRPQVLSLPPEKLKTVEKMFSSLREDQIPLTQADAVRDKDFNSLNPDYLLNSLRIFRQIAAEDKKLQGAVKQQDLIKLEEYLYAEKARAEQKDGPIGGSTDKGERSTEQIQEIEGIIDRLSK